jgi:hypothetical protein
LLSEVVVTTTAGEFVEIQNPTAAAIDLSDVYLTDATFAGGGTFYYNIVTGANAGGGSFGDFHARFPDGATIAPGEFQTVSLAGSDDFFATYGFNPTYELYEDGAGPDAIADMREALPGSINNQGGLTNSGEIVVLYTWDGTSDLVQDIDYALWGTSCRISTMRSGVTQPKRSTRLPSASTDRMMMQTSRRMRLTQRLAARTLLPQAHMPAATHSSALTSVKAMRPRLAATALRAATRHPRTSRSHGHSRR